MATNLTTLLATLTLFLAGGINGNPLSNKVSNENDEFTLRIVHTNDMHARFEETSRLSAPICPQKDVAEGKCYGGFARIATLVRQARNSSTPTLFLNAGDTYQGSVWYNIYKWKIVARFLDFLRPDAVSLGNHEFDDGVAGLIPFIDHADFPVLAANLNLTRQPDLAATKLAKHKVFDLNGTKIGVIGYLTPETTILSTTDNVTINDEIPAIRQEVKQLKTQGVNILIALGHSGFEMDKKIAKEVKDIDIVIGGHTNTFLYRGDQPDIEHPEGFYPTEVVQDDGRKVYVVQAYAYTKYLGNFTVKFDSKGEVTFIEGNPILVNSSIEQAPDILEEFEKFKPAIINITLKEVGKSRVLLDGDSKSCRRRECNMGNFIADAIVNYNAEEFVVKNGWTDAAIAVQNSGSIRASIARSIDDKITMGDVLGTLPFGNIIFKVSMTGEILLSMLEWSVYHLRENSTELYGSFLQYSGIQVYYDLSQPPNSKVISVQVRCADCRIPTYSNLNKTANYTVLLNDFMYSGGDGYAMLKNLEYTPLAVTTADIVVNYLKKHSPVYPGVEWRINYVKRSVNETEVSVTTDKETSTGSPASVREYSIRLLVLLAIINNFLT